MSISKNESHSEKLELLGERYQGGCVVGETEIYELINTLRVADWEAFAARMQVVVDATSAHIEDETRELDESALQLVKQVSRESQDKIYRQIMGTMVAAIERGGEGIKSAHRTASVAVDMVFIWTPDYFSALRQYANKLGRMRRKT